MSVDYSPVGGIGFEITEEIIEAFYQKVFPDHEEFEGDDAAELIADYLGCLYAKAGNGYTGRDNKYYACIEGKNLGEISWNGAAVISKLNVVTGWDWNGQSDLKPLEDLYIY